MQYFMYVSLQGDDKISRLSMDVETGKLELQAEVEVTGGPAPLAMDPQRRYLYVGRRGSLEVSSYGVDPGTGDLTFLGTAPVETDPCYIATDRRGRFLLSAYYEGGVAAVHPIDEGGVVRTPPVEWLSTARGAHSLQTDPSNKYAYVPHISGRGPNTILQFRYDENTGRLTPNVPDRFSPAEELGPRHFCFHPSMAILYFSDEQGCSVTGYNLDLATGTLAPFQTISTLPAGFNDRNSCSQIQITPSGRFLYAPNRGHNSIACFSVDSSSGVLTAVGRAPAEPVPRAFSIDPGGKFLYAAGLESGKLASYRINQSSGELVQMELYQVGNRPMWVFIAELG